MASKKTFLSYSHSDSIFAIKLTENLKNAGANLWFDQREILPGQQWITEVGDALKESQVHLIILSKSSLESRKCLDEVYNSYAKNKLIIPIVIEECEIPWWLENVQNIDFRDDYGSSFNKLLASLDLTTTQETSTAPKGFQIENQKQKEVIEEFLWSKTKKDNSISSYQKYLAETELHKHTEEANLIIAKLKDAIEQKLNQQKEKKRILKLSRSKQIGVKSSYSNGLIKKYFTKRNKHIKIISNGGEPYRIPREWRPILGRCEMLIIIPNMHMYIYNSHLDNFKFGARTLISFLRHLETIKEEMALKDKSLRVYQLGDLYEQRFPGLHSANATAIEIRMSHPDYDQIINMMNGLRTHFIYGNHDFELRHFPGYQFASLEGKVYVEHGFTPDSWKDFSNPNDNMWEVGQFVFLTIREISEYFNRMLIQAQFVQKDNHYSWGISSGKEPVYNYPSEEVYMNKFGQYVDYFAERIKKNPENEETKICVVGHSHNPFLHTDFNGGKQIYIDAGAWTEGRSDFVVITNDEVAICCYER